MLRPDMLLMLYNLGIVGIMKQHSEKGSLLWEEGIGLHVWWPETDCTLQETLEQKWWCEVGGVTWWLGNPDIEWREVEFVARNNRLMWRRDSCTL